jgi:hypothetical protein
MMLYGKLIAKKFGVLTSETSIFFLNNFATLFFFTHAGVIQKMQHGRRPLSQNI